MWTRTSSSFCIAHRMCSPCNSSDSASAASGAGRSIARCRCRLDRTHTRSVGFGGGGGGGGGGGAHPRSFCGMAGAVRVQSAQGMPRPTLDGDACACGANGAAQVRFDEFLDLRPYCTAECLAAASPRYRLYAVLVHEGGSLHSGHYYAYVRAATGIWYLFDDSKVSQVRAGRRAVASGGGRRRAAAGGGRACQGLRRLGVGGMWEGRQPPAAQSSQRETA